MVKMRLNISYIVKYVQSKIIVITFGSGNVQSCGTTYFQVLCASQSKVDWVPVFVLVRVLVSVGYWMTIHNTLETTRLDVFTTKCHNNNFTLFIT
jgi:hypothetical protein